MITDDVPSPIDLRLMADAQEWDQSAILKRPWRVDFFSCFVMQIEQIPVTMLRVLELGSGPEFMAKHVLESTRDFSYVMLILCLHAPACKGQIRQFGNPGRIYRTELRRSNLDIGTRQIRVCTDQPGSP